MVYDGKPIEMDDMVDIPIIYQNADDMVNKYLSIYIYISVHMAVS